MSGSLVPIRRTQTAEPEFGPSFDLSSLVQPREPAMVPAVIPQIRDSMDANYAKLAAAVGIDNYPIRMATLERVLAENILGFYKRPDVDSYLKKQSPKGMIWCWKPLRKADQDSLGLNVPSYDNGDYNGTVYQKQVPFVVLALVGMIDHVAPNNFDFVVSDFESPAQRPVVAPMNRLDPFLGVAARGMREQPWRVIFHWDEPDFKGGFSSKGYIER